MSGSIPRPVRCSARVWRRRIARRCGSSCRVSAVGSSRWRWRRRPGWRFVVEELRRVGAVVHLAEPAETAELRGSKKRAKSDRADARHLRELLMIERLPESWIPPDHILDLRARVRLRHTLSEQRGEWQQRIQATLYHHGCPQRRSLMIGDGREWLAAQPLPARRARAGHDRARDDRRARGADRAARQGAARVCAPPGRAARR